MRTLAVLAVLGTTELALRQPVVRGALPPRTHYYNTSVTTRLDALEAVRRAEGRIDVLFVGSSIVYTDIRPLMFDRATRPSSVELVSFNAGMAGMWPEGVRLYLENLWLPAARPSMVVQGVRYPELAAETPAKHDSQIWTGTVEAAWRLSSWQARVRSGAASHLALLQYRGVLTAHLLDYTGGRQGELDEPYAAVRGWHPRPSSPGHDPTTASPDLPIDGACLACGAGLAALRGAIAAARRAGADYVLVNVPEHGVRWRVPDGERRYREYLHALRDLAMAEGVTFIDPTGGNPFAFEDNALFFDLSHMTPAGASIFTNTLAGELAPVVRALLEGSPAAAHAPAAAAGR